MKFSDWLETRDACYEKVKARYKKWPSAYASGALVQCRKKGAKNWGISEEKSIEEGIFKMEKEKGLHGWFSRNHGKGWIDCKQSTKKKKVPCGRKKAGKGAEREYPACRPTLSACNGSKKKKKSESPISWKK